jgi:hypothetical protein
MGTALEDSPLHNGILPMNSMLMMSLSCLTFLPPVNSRNNKGKGGYGADMIVALLLEMH